MRFITRISPETKQLLKRIEKKSNYYQVSRRAKCIQLSYQGYQITELVAIFNVSVNTINNWLKNWEKYN